MGKESPYYKWFPKDFAADPRVLAMDNNQELIYRRLLDRSWELGSLPSKPSDLARLAGVSPRTLKKAWGFPLNECWVEDGEGRLVNHRLEEERENYTARSSKSVAAAKERWSNRRKRLRVKDPVYADALPKDAIPEPEIKPEPEPEPKPALERARFSEPPVPDDPEAATGALIDEINRYLPDQRLKAHAGLVKPIANLLLCGHPGGVMTIRDDHDPFTFADLLDVAHGYIVAEAKDPYHINERARGKPYAFSRLLSNAERVAEYAERGRKVWDAWCSEQGAGSELDEEAEAIAKCPRDHEREKERRGIHWVCPAICGWNEVIRAKEEDTV